MTDELKKALAGADAAFNRLSPKEAYKPLLPMLLQLDRQDRDRLLKLASRLTGTSLKIVRDDFNELERKHKAQKKAEEVQAEIEAQLGDGMISPPKLDQCLMTGDFLPLLVALQTQPWEQDRMMPRDTWGNRPTLEVIRTEAEKRGLAKEFERDSALAPQVQDHRELVMALNQGFSQSITTSLRGALITYKSGGQDAPPIPVLVSSPFIIVATGDNGQSEVPNPHLLVKMLRADKTWVEHIIDISTLTSGGWRAELAKRDLMVQDPNVFMLALQAARASGLIKQRFTTVERVGWLSDHSAFVMPSGEIVSSAAHPAPNIVSVFKRNPAWVVGGNKDAADEMVRRCAGNKRLVLAASVALSSPYFPLLGAENGGVHLFGDTSQGKTTIACVAGSMFGKGDELKSAGNVRSWNTTLFAVGLVGPEHNDLYLIYDELKTVGQKKETLQQVIHMVSKGIGKDAGGPDGALRDKAPFVVQLISTGECSIQDAMRQADLAYEGGESVRILDIPAVTRGASFGVFEKLPPEMDGSAFSDYLKDTAKQHYGHHGRAVLQHLVEKGEDALRHAQQRIGELRFELGERFGDEADVGRVLDRLAIYGGIGEYHAKQKLVPWDSGEAAGAVFSAARDWQQARGGEGKQEALAALRHFTDYVERYRARFVEASADRGDEAESTLTQAQYVQNVGGYTRLDAQGRREFWFTHPQLAEAVGQEQRVQPFLDHAAKGDSSIFELVREGTRLQRRTPRGWDANREWRYCLRRREAAD